MIEDEVLAAMQRHETDAPDPALLTIPSYQRGRITSAMIVTTVIAVGLLVGVIATFAIGRHSTGRGSHVPTAPATGGALSCPASLPSRAPDTWVPAMPTAPGSDTRLVPLATPTRVVVCGYPSRTTSSPRSVVLAGDLSGVARDLASVARRLPGGTGAFICAYDGGSSGSQPYLIGLNYPDGYVWVAAVEGACANSGNGRFTSIASLGGLAAAWQQAGHWTPSPTHPPCAPPWDGRLGQETAMVPATPVTLTICNNATHKVVGTFSASDPVVRQLIGALNAAPLRPDAPSCRPTSTAPGHNDTLNFGYASGPIVTVITNTSCDPSAQNGSVANHADIAALLQRLEARH